MLCERIQSLLCVVKKKAAAQEDDGLLDELLNDLDAGPQNKPSARGCVYNQLTVAAYCSSALSQTPSHAPCALLCTLLSAAST